MDNFEWNLGYEPRFGLAYTDYSTQRRIIKDSGRFYNSLGHHADIIAMPQVLEIMRRGFLWAAEGREIAVRQGLDHKVFANEARMF